MCYGGVKDNFLQLTYVKRFKKLLSSLGQCRGNQGSSSMQDKLFANISSHNTKWTSIVDLSSPTAAGEDGSRNDYR